MQRKSIFILFFSILLLASFTTAVETHWYNFSNVNDLTGSSNGVNFGGDSILDYPVFNISGDSSPNSFEFDGINEYLEIPIIPNNNYHSISLWFKSNDTSGYMYNYRSATASSHTRIYFESACGNYLTYEVWDGTTRQICSPIITQDGEWHHVVFTINEVDNELRGYLDGKLDASLNVSINLNFNAGQTTIAKAEWMMDRYWNGSIDELKEFNHILNLTEVQNLYNCNNRYCDLTDELISYYKSDTNGSYPDALGVNNGTIFNVDFTVSGKINGAYEWDGVGYDYVNLGNIGVDGTDDRSYGFWIKMNTIPTDDIYAILSQRVDATDGTNIMIAMSDTLGLYLSIDGAFKNYNDSVIPWDDNNWHFVVVTFSGNTMADFDVYGDGDLLTPTTVDDPTQAVNTDSTDTLLGKRIDEAWDPFDGILDEVFIYNRVLTPTEINFLFNNGNGFQYPFLNLSAPIITNINCTSCNPPTGDNVTPYTTTDITPTFNFSTDINANCRYSNNLTANYTEMGSSRNCTTTGALSHICTLISADALSVGLVNTSAVCQRDDALNESTTFFEMNISASTPVMNFSFILPTTAYTNDTLKGWCNATDSENYTLQYNYTWYLNEVLNNTGNTSSGLTQGINKNVANISSTLTSSGQNWTLSCLASNPYLSSSWLNSSVLTISNAEPITQTSTIKTSTSYNLCYQDIIDNSNQLEGWCNVTDLDGDNISYYYRWFKDDVLNTSGNDSGGNIQGLEINVNNISISDITIGDNWTFSCRATDGYANSSWLNSSTPVIHNISFTIDGTDITTLSSPIIKEVGDTVILNATITTGETVCIDDSNNDFGTNYSCGVNNTYFDAKDTSFSKTTDSDGNSTLTYYYIDEGTQTFKMSVNSKDDFLNMSFYIYGGLYNGSFPDGVKLYIDGILSQTLGLLSNTTTNYNQNSFNNIATVNICYQEFSNVSTACGGVSTGVYLCTGNFTPSNPCSNGYDGNWDTLYSTVITTTLLNATMYINYTKPENVNGAIWQLKDGLERADFKTNFTVPTNCFNQSVLQFKVSSFIRILPIYVAGRWSCWNGNSWSSLRFYELTFAQHIYEEAIYWNYSLPRILLTGASVDNIGYFSLPKASVVTYSNMTIIGLNGTNYPTNSWIEVGFLDGTYEWNYTGIFSTSNRNGKFTTAFNTYLSVCTADSDGYCEVPVYVYSDTDANMIINNISIIYNYTINPVYLDNTIFQTALDTGDGVMNITIGIKNSQSGSITINNLNYDYLGGSSPIDTLVAHSTDYWCNVTNTLQYSYSGWTYTLPPNVNYINWYPWDKNAQNVTPFGQNSVPILNITTTNYGSNLDFAMRMYGSSDCVTLTVDTDNNKAGGTTMVNNTYITLATNQSEDSTFGIWLWADLACSYTDWRLWSPSFEFKAEVTI